MVSRPCCGAELELGYLLLRMLLHLGSSQSGVSCVPSGSVIRRLQPWPCCRGSLLQSPICTLSALSIPTSVNVVWWIHFSIVWLRALLPSIVDRERPEVAHEPESVVVLAVADGKLDFWAKIWTFHTQSDCAMQVPVWAPALEQPAVEDIRKVCASFKKNTGIGTDQLHPRWTLHVSDHAVQALIAVLVMCERLLLWPSGLRINRFSVYSNLRGVIG